MGVANLKFKVRTCMWKWNIYKQRRPRWDAAKCGISSGSALFAKINTLLVIVYIRGQKYFNIALVLQDEWLTIFTCPANTYTCPLKVYAIKNIREWYVKWLPSVILPKAPFLQDECFGKNYSSFLDFTRNFERTTGIFVPCIIWSGLHSLCVNWWQIFKRCLWWLRWYQHHHKLCQNWI